MAVIRPKMAPLVFTPFRFRPYNISSKGTNKEKSHRVGGIVPLSIQKKFFFFYLKHHFKKYHLPSFGLLVINENATFPSHRDNDIGMVRPHNSTGKKSLNFDVRQFDTLIRNSFI